MNRKSSATLVAVMLFVPPAFSQNDKWLPNDVNRPVPPVITPGAEPGAAPSDAIILFDGKDLSAWRGADGADAKWKLVDGAMEIAPRSGNIHSKQAFGDCQLHIEWKEPSPAHGTDQERGNSGIMLMSTYEVQVLDMDGNKTYADGGAGAIYGQYPPLVTAARKSGEWQAYDIIFRRPHFDAAGHLTSPARLTVLLNGVLVQDNVAPTGPTAFHDRPPYLPGPDKYPISLQDHGTALQFRNVWIRELSDREPDLHYTADEPIQMSPQDLAVYAGNYEIEGGATLTVEVSGNGLTMRRQPAAGRAAPAAAPSQGASATTAPATPMPTPLLVPINEDSFVAEWSGNSSRVTFTRAAGRVTGLIVQQGEIFQFAKRIDNQAATPAP